MVKLYFTHSTLRKQPFFAKTLISLLKLKNVKFFAKTLISLLKLKNVKFQNPGGGQGPPFRRP